MSQRRWIQEATANQYKSVIRPLEGDLLFFPLTKDLYEIKFVEVEAVFHQFGKLQFYQITAEIYEMGNESIDTGIADIDLIENILTSAINVVMLNGSGTIAYEVGETVTGSISGVTAKVTEWNPTTRTLTVITRTGTFVEEEMLVGEESDAEWEVQSFRTQEDPNTDYDQNKYIQDEADDILDFTEKNPFGEYGNFGDSF